MLERLSSTERHDFRTSSPMSDGATTRYFRLSLTLIILEGSAVLCELPPTPTPCLASMILWTCWPVNSGFQLWIWRVVIGRKLAARLPLPLIRVSFSSRSCHLDFAMPRHFRAADGLGHLGVALVPLSGLP